MEKVIESMYFLLNMGDIRASYVGWPEGLYIDSFLY